MHIHYLKLNVGAVFFYYYYYLPSSTHTIYKTIIFSHLHSFYSHRRRNRSKLRINQIKFLAPRRHISNRIFATMQIFLSLAAASRVNWPEPCMHCVRVAQRNATLLSSFTLWRSSNVASHLNKNRTCSFTSFRPHKSRYSF